MAFSRCLATLAALALLAGSSFGQAAPPSVQDVPTAKPAEVRDKRLLAVIPNYRTCPPLAHYQPISTREKFQIASDESFHWGTLALAGVFAAEGQLKNSAPSFGQGLQGFGRYYGANYADLVLSYYMTDAIFPTILHQDPRYFRRGAGGGWSRLGNAVSQIFWTHKDSGGRQFNYSEIAGNSTAVAISSAYYPDQRDVGDAVSKLGFQIGLDMVGNILREFGPDLLRKVSRGPKPASLDH